MSHFILQSRLLFRALLVSAVMIPCAAVYAQDAHQDMTADETPANDVPEPSALEWSLLSPEIPVTDDKSAKIRTPAKPSDGNSTNWNRTDKSDGGSALTVKQSALPFGDAKFGADLNVAGQMPTTSSDALAAKISGNSFQSTGSAWANMTAPGLGNIWDKTTLEARVDPTLEQTKVGTAISKTLPLGSQPYAVTLQNGYNVIQSAVPMVGADGRASKGAVEVDRSAKLEFKDSGTSLLAGETMSTIDEKWLRRVGVEQKMFGGVNVTGTVSETPTGVANRSLTAGYKYNW